MYADLRAFLEALRCRGDLIEIAEEVDPKFEIAAALASLDRRQGPVPLFTKVRGSAHAVTGNILATRARLALALGCGEGEIEETYLERVHERREPRLVREAPCQEVALEGGQDVLASIPVLTHHEEDAGAYFTSAVTIARHPDTGARAIGIHRIQVKRGNHLGIYLQNPPISTLFALVEGRDQALEVAVVVGLDPITYFASVTWDPALTDKFAIAGGLAGEPIELVRCVSKDLEAPASAEFVLEGRVLPHVRETEGPFGETSNYYITSDNPVIDVDVITHRRAPIYQGLVASGQEAHVLNISGQAENIRVLRDTFPEVRKVSFKGRGLVVVQLAKRRQTKARAIFDYLLLNNRSLKTAILVDEDIDPFVFADVEWALGTRFQPSRDLYVRENVEGWGIDPSAGEDKRTSKLGIDATAPLEGRERFRRIEVPRAAAEAMEKLLAKHLKG
ncbi:MAG: UbiD family decarboxylase [Candidatus Tectomicrobia bacterium]|nr:UbiD family decarboxylase [Candidatus Tectomicrobia bacterium]